MSHSTKRRRHGKAYAIALPTTGVLAMVAIAIIMLVVALTDVELSFDFSPGDNPPAVAAEDGN